MPLASAHSLTPFVFVLPRPQSREANQREFPMATVGKVLTKIFGSRNERLLKRYRTIVTQINDLEPKVQAMSDPDLRARTRELREGLTSRKLRSVEVLPEAFAIIRESMDRHIGIRSIFNP